RLYRKGFVMSFTMEDFNRQYIKEHFPQLTAHQQEEVLKSLPPERRLAGLSPEEIRHYLDRLTHEKSAAPSERHAKKESPLRTLTIKLLSRRKPPSDRFRNARCTERRERPRKGLPTARPPTAPPPAPSAHVPPRTGAGRPAR